MINVLVVDDSLVIRGLLVRVLSVDRQLKVVAAEDVLEAEQLLNDDHFDVITLDEHMPGMSGLDFLTILKSRHDAPVVMLSSSTVRGTDFRTSALMAGAAGVFDKADAVRRSPDLIKLIKNVSHHSARIEPADRAAIKKRIAASA